MVRLKSDIWASAWLRRCATAGVSAYLRHRGAAEAGAIFLKIDCLDGNSVLYGPADQGDYRDDTIDRLFRRIHDESKIHGADAEAILTRELKFDRDIWILEADDPEGRCFAECISA